MVTNSGTYLHNENGILEVRILPMFEYSDTDLDDDDYDEDDEYTESDDDDEYGDEDDYDEGEESDEPPF